MTAAVALARPFLRMSEAGHCRRQQGYACLGYPASPLRPEQRSIFERGDAGEAIICRRLREQGYTIIHDRTNGSEQRELEVAYPPRIGHPDGWIRPKGKRLWWLLECKTISTYTWRRIAKGGVEQEAPEYADQAHQYLLAERAAGNRLVGICYAILDANTCQLLIKMLPVSTRDWDSGVNRRLVEAWGYIEHGELPPRDYDGTTWHCDPRYCRYARLCWPDKHSKEQTP